MMGAGGAPHTTDMTGNWETTTAGEPTTPLLGLPQIPSLTSPLTHAEAKQVALGHLTRRRVLEPLNAKQSKWAQPKPSTQPHPGDLIDETRIVSTLEALGYQQMGVARQVHTKTNVLRLLFDLPAARRPPTLGERRTLAGLLDEDALFVNRAAHSLLLEAPGCREGQDLLAGWSLGDLDVLASLPPAHAQAWGRSAATCYPVPHPKQVRALKDQLLTLSGDAGWGSLVDCLVAGVIAQECEGGQGCPNWDAHIRQAAAWPGSPLGQTPGEVNARLRRALPQFVPIPSMPVLASMLLPGG